MRRREASADARTLARMVRDHFDALTAEGFTAKEALTFLAVWLASVPPAEQKPNDTDTT